MSKSVSPANLMKSTEGKLVYASSLETGVDTHTQTQYADIGAQWVRERGKSGGGEGTEETKGRGGGVWDRQRHQGLRAESVTGSRMH